MRRDICQLTCSAWGREHGAMSCEINRLTSRSPVIEKYFSITIDKTQKKEVGLYIDGGTSSKKEFKVLPGNFVAA